MALKLEKKIVFFGLEDVLVKGKLDDSFKEKQVKEMLVKVKELEEKGDLTAILFSGSSKEIAEQKINENKLTDYFKKENIRLIDDFYLKQKSDLDKKLYDKKINENPEFKDEFFKQWTIKREAEKNDATKFLLVGHDILFDAYYNLKFSQIDFVLIKSALSDTHLKEKNMFEGLPYIKRTWADLSKALEGKIKLQNPDAFIKLIEKQLAIKLVGKEKLFSIVNMTLEKKAGENTVNLQN